MKKSINASQPQMMNELGAPDLSDRISEYSWRPNLKTLRMELVRKRDGFVLDRVPMTRKQIERYGEDGMSKGVNIEEFIGKKIEGTTLTVESAAEPDPLNRAKRVNVLCDCGVRKVAILTNLRAGLIKSCGHLRFKKANGEAGKSNVVESPKSSSPAFPEPEIAVPAVTEPEPTKAVVCVGIMQPAPASNIDFRNDLIETGKDISLLIRFARKLDPTKVQTLLSEIDRVASSPFAAIPEGAREEAAAAQEFINRLQLIGV